jgi:hypothetical protein
MTKELAAVKCGRGIIICILYWVTCDELSNAY